MTIDCFPTCLEDAFLTPIVKQSGQQIRRPFDFHPARCVQADGASRCPAANNFARLSPNVAGDSVGFEMRLFGWN
jgi:hypothetical protein